MLAINLLQQCELTSLLLLLVLSILADFMCCQMDVLVAESSAPAKAPANKGIKARVMELIKKVAGVGTVSPNRIVLLRDTNGDGVADFRSVMLDGLNSPFGMTLVGNQLYVANTDSVLRFPYSTRDTRIKVAGRKLLDLPAG